MNIVIIFIRQAISSHVCLNTDHEIQALTLIYACNIYEQYHIVLHQICLWLKSLWLSGF